MSRVILAGAMALALAGCAQIPTPADADYEFGDTSESVLDARTEYCATADPERRAIALALINAAGATLPPGGICTDILDVIGDRSLEELTGADYEAAREAQRKAQERLEAEE